MRAAFARSLATHRLLRFVSRSGREPVKDYDKMAQVLREGRLLPAAPVHVPVETLEEAYKIHCSIASKCPGNRAGWKVGASNAAAIARLGLKESFRGPLFQPTIRKTPAKVAWEEMGVALFAVEAEFAFKMRKQLVPRFETYTNEEVWDAVESVHPAIEVAASRSPLALPLSPDTIATIVGDFALHGVLAIGEGVNARKVDVQGLVDVEATITRKAPGEDTISNKGKGANVLGNPLTSLAWLVNSLRKDGVAVERDQIVSTGAAALLTADQVPWGKACLLEMTIGALYPGGAPVSISLNLPDGSVRPWEIPPAESGVR